MPTIRKYKETDKEAVRNICVVTSGLPTETKKDKDFLFLMFNDYYTDFEPDSTFVAVDDDDNAVGYILCAKDFDIYRESMEKFFLPRIRQLGLKYTIMAKTEMFIHSLFKKKYPAHLHIDIHPDYQKMGLGTLMIDALSDYLKGERIYGLMLSAGMNNKGAIAFYGKNGFCKEANIIGSVVMGKKL